tara:strand:- start:3213 stop:3368 length:156 start_codon:yes stop_codon:yes gene_type:complete
LKEYEITTKGGSKFKIKAKNLIELFKDIHLVYMNELGYLLDEFISIEEITD